MFLSYIKTITGLSYDEHMVFFGGISWQGAQTVRDFNDMHLSVQKTDGT